MQQFEFPTSGDKISLRYLDNSYVGESTNLTIGLSSKPSVNPLYEFYGLPKVPQ